MWQEAGNYILDKAMADSDNQQGYEPDEITPEMIEAGIAILRRDFGGETEGQNRFVDFRETVQAILKASLETSESACPSA